MPFHSEGPRYLFCCCEREDNVVVRRMFTWVYSRNSYYWKCFKHCHILSRHKVSKALSPEEEKVRDNRILFNGEKGSRNLFLPHHFGVSSGCEPIRWFLKKRNVLKEYLAFASDLTFMTLIVILLFTACGHLRGQIPMVFQAQFGWLQPRCTRSEYHVRRRIVGMSSN